MNQNELISKWSPVNRYPQQTWGLEFLTFNREPGGFRTLHNTIRVVRVLNKTEKHATKLAKQTKTQQNGIMLHSSSENFMPKKNNQAKQHTHACTNNIIDQATWLVLMLPDFPISYILTAIQSNAIRDNLTYGLFWIALEERYSNMWFNTRLSLSVKEQIAFNNDEAAKFGNTASLTRRVDVRSKTGWKY